jgi:tRNA (Thr-GGU) A37 N-methylase
MPSQAKIVLEPIGFVRTSAVGDVVKDKTCLSQIVINDEFAEALDGVNGFSHVFVLFWLHGVSDEQRKTLKVHPRGRSDVLTVRGLDAFDGTPVLDIKPFDSWDNASTFKVPGWWIKLEKQKAQSG